MDKKTQTIYCGIDDSNHGSDNEGEIIAIIFSRIKGDSIVRHFRPTRKIEETLD